MSKRKILTEETEGKLNMSDEEGSTSNHWAVLLVKGYQAMQSQIRRVILKKNIANCSLSYSKKRSKQRIGRDLVVAKNFFEKLTSLLAALSHR